MTIEELPTNKKIVLYDGVCNFCNNSVNYIISKDKKDIFRFVSLQSKLGNDIINYIGLKEKNIDSIVLYQKGNAYYYKSSAAIQILKNFGGIYSIANILNYIPLSIRDYIYDIIAKNRYQWFGKKDSCIIPTQEIKDKFLDI